MSRENVEKIRRATAAFSRGDFEAAVADCDPFVCARMVENWPERVMVGTEAYVRFLREWSDALGNDLELLEATEVNDRVIAHFAISTRGETSGLETDETFCQITTWRGGRSVFIEFFQDYRAALDTVGMC